MPTPVPKAIQRARPDRLADGGWTTGSCASAGITAEEFGSVGIPAKNFDRRSILWLHMKFQHGADGSGQVGKPAVRKPKTSGGAESEDRVSSHHQTLGGRPAKLHHWRKLRLHAEGRDTTFSHDGGNHIR